MWVTLAACEGNVTKNKVLRLGFVPFENGEALLRNVQPLIEVIEKGLNMEVQPFIAADYTGVVEAFKSGNLDAGFMSPASYVLGHQEASIRVILSSQRNGQAFYYGAIITRTDSGIQQLKQLKGKKFSFGDPLSTSGYVFPRKILADVGINPDSDFENVIFSGSHDATILAVLHKKVDAGATYADDNQGRSSAWQRFLKPEESKLIKVLKYSQPIPSDTICVSKDFPEEQAMLLQKTMLDYSASPEGKALMKKVYHFDGYVKASDRDYDSVRTAFSEAGLKLKEQLRKK